MNKITKLPETPDTPRSILVVDDDDRVLLYLSRLLGAIGHTHTYTAASAAEAHQTWSRHSSKIWLLITDFVMPDENGDLLAQKLLKQKADLGVLFISGNDPASLNSRIELSPGKNFLQKPFTTADLRQMVQKLLIVRNQRVLDAQKTPASPSSPPPPSAEPVVPFPAEQPVESVSS